MPLSGCLSRQTQPRLGKTIFGDKLLWYERVSANATGVQGFTTMPPSTSPPAVWNETCDEAWVKRLYGRKRRTGSMPLQRHPSWATSAALAVPSASGAPQPLPTAHCSLGLLCSTTLLCALIYATVRNEMKGRGQGDLAAQKILSTFIPWSVWRAASLWAGRRSSRTCLTCLTWRRPRALRHSGLQLSESKTADMFYMKQIFFACFPPLVVAVCRFVAERVEVRLLAQGRRRRLQQHDVESSQRRDGPFHRADPLPLLSLLAKLAFSPLKCTHRRPPLSAHDLQEVC